MGLACRLCCKPGHCWYLLCCSKRVSSNTTGSHQLAPIDSASCPLLCLSACRALPGAVLLPCMPQNPAAGAVPAPHCLVRFRCMLPHADAASAATASLPLRHGAACAAVYHTLGSLPLVCRPLALLTAGCSPAVLCACSKAHVNRAQNHLRAMRGGGASAANRHSPRAKRQKT